MSTAHRRTLGQVTLDDPIDVSVDAPGPLELVHGHRGQLLADEVEELGGVVTGARVDVDDEGAVDAADDREVADAGPAPADAGGGGARPRAPSGANGPCRWWCDPGVTSTAAPGVEDRTVATYSDRARGESEEVMGSS